MTKGYKSPEIFICECHSTDHQMVFLFDEQDNLLYVHVHLKSRRFLERLWYGIRYILGRKSCYGAFDEFIFNHKDYLRLKAAIHHLKKRKKNEI